MPIKRIIKKATKHIRRAKAIKRVKRSVEAKKMRRLTHGLRQTAYQERTANLRKLGNPKRLGPRMKKRR